MTLFKKAIPRKQYNATTNKMDFSPRPQSPQKDNVFFRLHNLEISVNKYYTDVDGAIIAKGAVPAAIQTKFPVCLLGAFDSEGGFKVGLQNVPPMPNTFYLMSFVNGLGATSKNVVGFSGLNTIKGQISTGDLVHVYTDDLQNPSYFIWIVISAQSTSYASFLSNLRTSQNDLRIGQINIKEINYQADDISQFREDINFTSLDNIGSFENNPVNVYTFFGPQVEQEGFLTVKTSAKMNQYLGLNLYMRFACDSFSFNLKIE